MPRPAYQRAPKTCELIQEINQILIRRGLTREDFREELNRLLTPERQLAANHSGLVQVVRWLDPSSPNWSEPKGEIALAMRDFIQINQ